MNKQKKLKKISKQILCLINHTFLFLLYRGKEIKFNLFLPILYSKQRKAALNSSISQKLQQQKTGKELKYTHK